MSDESEFRRELRRAGISESTQRLILETLREVRRPLAHIAACGGFEALARAGEIAHLIEPYRETMQMVPMLRPYILDSMQEVSDWPGKGIGLDRIELSFPTELRPLIAKLDGYYRALLLDAKADKSDAVARISAQVELQVPLELLAELDSSGLDQIVFAADAMRHTARNLSRDIFRFIDDSVWSANLAAISQWADYSIDYESTFPGVRSFGLPANCLGAIRMSLAEAVDDRWEKESRELEKLKEGIEQAQRSAKDLPPSNAAGGGGLTARTVIEPASPNSLAEREPYSIEIRNGVLFVRTALPVLVMQPGRREVSSDSDVELDRNYFTITNTRNPQNISKVLSGPKPLEDERDPAETTRLSWWVSKEGEVNLVAAVDGTPCGSLEFKKRRGELTMQARLLMLFLQSFPKGVRLREVAKEIYGYSRPDSACLDGDTLIMRVRTLIWEISKRFENAELDTRIVPRSWGKKSVSKSLRLNVAGVTRIRGKEDPSSGKTTQHFDD